MIRRAETLTKTIHKKIVLNENNKPVEVIISYDEWQEVERLLESNRPGMVKENLKKYAGTVHIEESHWNIRKECGVTGRACGGY